MEVVAETLATGLAEGRPVVVLTSTASPSPVPRREVLGNLEVRRLRTVEFAHTAFMPALALHLLRLPRDVVLHVHIAVAYAPEMVWLVSRLRRQRYVAHFHLDVDPSGPLGPLFLLYKRFVLGAVLRGAARVIAVSPDQPELLQRIHGVDPSRITLIPNGVAPQFYWTGRRPPDPSRAFRLLAVGRLAPQKNLSLLLRAVSLMRQPVEVRIVGDGEERSMLQAQIDDLRLRNVELCGAKSGEALVQAYRWADAFVLTSVKESTGLVLLEAFAAGLPVVATDAPGVRHTVGADGILVPPDAERLAEALDRLVSDPDAWATWASRSSARARQHPWSPQLTALEDLYDRVYGGPEPESEREPTS